MDLQGIRILVTIIVLSVFNNKLKTNGQQTSDLELTDFLKIVNASTFVDKSLLIRELLAHRNVFVTAPPGFGKSTNLDMVRLFLETKVSETGISSELSSTPVYEIFVKLKIYENKTFFDAHFGKHPVIHIDYSALCGATDFENMLVIIREILKKTFLPHRYLLKNPKLFSSQGGKTQFSYYSHRFFYKQLTAHDIGVGFHWLSRLLYLHFKTPVTVLIDEYNTFYDFLNKKHDDYQRIVKLISSVNEYLLNSNDFLDRVVLTGTPVKTDAILPEHIETFNFLNDHPFWKYFGITVEELEELLTKLIQNEQDRAEIRRTCVDNNGLTEKELEEVLAKVVRNSEQREKIKLMCMQNQYSHVIRATGKKIFSFNTTFDIFENKTNS